MKLADGLKVLGCIALSLLSATAGFGAAAGPLAEADALLASPTLSMSQADRALSLYEGLLSTAAGAPGRQSCRAWPIPASFWANSPPSRKVWGTTKRGSLTPRP